MKLFKVTIETLNLIHIKTVLFQRVKLVKGETWKKANFIQVSLQIKEKILSGDNIDKSKNKYKKW